MSQLAFGMPGPAEWFWIAIILVLVFGARKLPELARAMGSSVTQFKKGLGEDPDLLDEAAKKQDSKDPS